MTKFKFKLVFCGLLVSYLFLATKSAQSAEASFEYPELAVVPRASEIIDTESTRDKNQNYKTHLPYLVPAATTFATGLVLLSSGTKYDVDATNTGAKYAPWIGIGVGLAWGITTFAILNRLDYYADGTSEIAKMPSKSQREQLARERRAEESIKQAGAVACKLKWISFGSNIAASGFMAISAKQKSFPVYLAIASAAAAFTPLIFPHRWQTVDRQHSDYKKRIYGPVVGATLLQDPTTDSLSPGLSLALQF